MAWGGSRLCWRWGGASFRRAFPQPSDGRLSTVVAALNVDYGLFVELVAGRGLVVRAESLSGAKPAIAAEASFDGTRSLAGHALDHGQACIVEDLHAETRFNDASLTRHGLRSVVGRPLKYCERRLGVVIFGSTRVNEFRSTELAFFEGLAQFWTAGWPGRKPNIWSKISVWARRGLGRIVRYLAAG